MLNTIKRIGRFIFRIEPMPSAMPLSILPNFPLSNPEIFFLNNPRIKGLISPLSSNSSNISDDLIMNEDISSLLVECSENNYSDVSSTLNYSNTEKSSNVFDSFNSNFNLMTSLPTSPYHARVFGYRTLKTSDELELEYREDIYDKNLEQKERTPKNPS